MSRGIEHRKTIDHGGEINPSGLSSRELGLICNVFRRHPQVSGVVLYGSRARGTHRPESDIDLAIHGDIDNLATEAIAAELDELPLPYSFDVKAYDDIRSAAWRDDIRRSGVVLYGEIDDGSDASA
jgi:predicted nucleotidyltransferase